MQTALVSKRKFNVLQPQNSVLAWYDVGDLAFINETSNAIDQFTDKSGNGNHFTASGADRATLVSNQYNGLPTARFDRSNQYDVPAGLFNLGGAANTIIGVAKRDAVSSFETLFNLSDGATAKYFIFYNNSSDVISFKSRNAAGGTATIALDSSELHAFIGRRVGLGQGISVNNSAKQTNLAGTDITGIDSGDLGASNNNNLFFDGDFCELIICNTGITDKQVLRFYQYLSRKWGLALDGS